MAEFPRASLPSTDPSTSYWLSQSDPELASFRSGNQLPKYVDTIIVGSGFSGALIAWDLLSRGYGKHGKSLLMLEARSTASGATGRNGGHIKPDCYRNYTAFKAQFGSENAKSQCTFELANMRATVEFIRQQNLVEAVDLVETRAADIFMTQTAWKAALESLNSLREAGGAVSEIETYQAEEAQTRFRVEGCYGAVTYPACSLWPHKLAAILIQRCLEKGLQLFTHTPALKVQASQSPGKWDVATSRGSLTCSRIFHATNAYASTLLPDLTGKIVPVKGNVTAINPSAAFAQMPLDHTYGIQWGEDFDYLIQRPNDGRPLIYGGGDLAHKYKLLGPIGDSQDASTNPDIISQLENFVRTRFQGWGSEVSVRVAWSGIMAFTADGLPFVGELPGREGQFIAAGFNGHGMARIFLTIRALCQLAHDEPLDSRVPRPYFDVQHRLARQEPEWEAMIAESKATKAEFAVREDLGSSNFPTLS